MGKPIRKVEPQIRATCEYCGRYEGRRMPRATLVVDENVAVLASSLETKDFRVIVPTKGTSDEKIMKELLPERVLVTKNEKDFFFGAPEYGYNIISLNALRFIDPLQTDRNKVAIMIGEAWSAFSLKSRSKIDTWVLRLHANGKHEFRAIE